jgi:hypothetical protein
MASHRAEGTLKGVSRGTEETTFQESRGRARSDRSESAGTRKFKRAMFVIVGAIRRRACCGWPFVWP